MATNKNQHFVPKCYLKAFSTENTGLAINLFNIDHARFIVNAPLKHQCSGDYFYGEDLRLERAFQTLEGGYSTLLKEILKPGYVLTDEHRSFLLEFWLIQHLRTEAASMRAVEMAEKISIEAGIDAQEYRLGIKEAVQHSMEIAIDQLPAVQDMKICLLRNRTSEPFVTSDDPAISTNLWYLESEKTKGDSFGVGAAGAIFLLPLTPNILCVAYDGDVYSIPHNNGWVDTKRKLDVQALNQHQFLNCNANVYTHDKEYSESIRVQYEKVRHLRPLAKHLVHYAVFAGSKGGSSEFRVIDRSKAPEHDRALIHFQSVRPKPSAWPAVIRRRNNGAVFTNGTGLGYVRRLYCDANRNQGFRKVRPW
ncbi:MAG: DUF4238 domain-containing protein [Pseudomonadota bacterium]